MHAYLFPSLFFLCFFSLFLSLEAVGAGEARQQDTVWLFGRVLYGDEIRLCKELETSCHDSVCVCAILYFTIPLHATRRAMAAATIFPPLRTNPVPDRND